MRVRRPDSKLGRPPGTRIKRNVSPWKLNPSEARALDGIIAFDTNIDAAKHLGISLKTLENTLRKAYEHMLAAGLDLGTEPRSQRVIAMRAWLTYWWSDEGKANLRNVLLTSQPEA